MALMSPSAGRETAWYTDPLPTARAIAVAIKPPGVSADAVIGDLKAIADREDEPMKDRLAATDARIDRFKIDLAELATRHGWPQPKIDQFTGHLGDRLEKALAGGRLKGEQVIIFQRALQRI